MAMTNSRFERRLDFKSRAASRDKPLEEANDGKHALIGIPKFEETGPLTMACLPLIAAWP